MKTVANSPEEAQSRFGRPFYGGETQPELDERVQLGRFLVAAAFADFLCFPLEVTHTRDRRPDFVVNNGGTLVGVEVTKVANEELEWARSLQRKHKLGTMTLTPFLKGREEKRKRPDVLEHAFVTPTHVFGGSQEEEDEFWVAAAKKIVLRKTAILNSPDSGRQTENWLLIWDKLGSSASDLERRVMLLQPWLLEMWKPDWFTKLIFQENYSSNFVVLSQDTEPRLLGTVSQL